VVQLSKRCEFLSAVEFAAPDGHHVVWPQDIAVFVNAMLFYCATKPGLSRIYISLLDFRGWSIRTGKAGKMRAGPGFKEGWFVGKTMYGLFSCVCVCVFFFFCCCTYCEPLSLQRYCLHGGKKGRRSD